LGYDKALEKVISCLKSDDAVMRSEAAGALGSSRDKRAVEALIDAVGSSDTGLRINARRSLLRITGQHALYEDTKDKSPDEAKTRWRLWWEANKDGFSPRRQKRRTVEKADRAETLITRYDADNNGCLDKNELQKYFSDRSRRPETVKKGASLDAKMPVKTMDGKEIELSSLLKGPSILYFFATKCGYCVKAESFIKELSHLCKEKEMPLIGIASSRETVERLAPYIERTGFDFPIVIDYKGKFSQNNKVRGTPNVLVIDGKGTVADVYRGLPEQSKKQLIETVKNGKFLK
jgi:peroxiredoxin